MWKKIETCPYQRTVVLGCWNIDCWLYRTVGHRKDDHFVDQQWRRIETATHWHDLEEEPGKTIYPWTQVGARTNEDGAIGFYREVSSSTPKPTNIE